MGMYRFIRSSLSFPLQHRILFSIKDEANCTAFDESSCSKIKLNNGTVLYFREVGHYLAVVCILREENFERRGINDVKIALKVHY